MLPIVTHCGLDECHCRRRSVSGRTRVQPFWFADKCLQFIYSAATAFSASYTR